jgi:uncharacterized protein
MILVNLKSTFKFTRIMFYRTLYNTVLAALERQAVVGLLGPRQVGKTTLSLQILKEKRGIYLDLESSVDQAKLTNPHLFFDQYTDQLIVLDEIHLLPEIFSELRGSIDRGRRLGLRNGRFLVLGSASIDLLKQSSETLAGRIEYLELAPLQALEVAAAEKELTQLWLRGGFPDSLQAKTDKDSLIFRQNFIRTYLERDIPYFGPKIPTTTLRRLWLMLAHTQGSLLNASKLAESLSVTSPTVQSYIDLLCDLFLVRRLTPFFSNLKKRLVKSPKVYIRDSGIVHALLNLATYDELLGHPVIGSSYEGFVIENILTTVSASTEASFYRTAAGAEIDLLLNLGGKKGLWAIEIKHSLSPKLTKGNINALADLNPNKVFIVYPGSERYPLADNLEVIGLTQLLGLLME